MVLQMLPRPCHAGHRDIIEKTLPAPRNLPDAPGVARRGKEKNDVQTLSV